jgi:hypothetical protein
VDLAAGVDRNLFLFFFVGTDQADAPAVEGKQILFVQAEAELEDVGAFLEEETLFGEETPGSGSS